MKKLLCFKFVKAKRQQAPTKKLSPETGIESGIAILLVERSIIPPRQPIRMRAANANAKRNDLERAVHYLRVVMIIGTLSNEDGGERERRQLRKITFLVRSLLLRTGHLRFVYLPYALRIE